MSISAPLTFRARSNSSYKGEVPSGATMLVAGDSFVGGAGLSFMGDSVNHGVIRIAHGASFASREGTLTNRGRIEMLGDPGDGRLFTGNLTNLGDIHVSPGVRAEFNHPGAGEGGPVYTFLQDTGGSIIVGAGGESGSRTAR